DTKDIQVIDISESDEELPQSVTRKCKRLIQSGRSLNKNVVDISSSDDETMVALSDKKNVDAHIQKDETMSFYKQTLRLIDEDTDEEFDSNESIDVVVDDVQKNDKSNKAAPSSELEDSKKNNDALGIDTVEKNSDETEISLEDSETNSGDYGIDLEYSENESEEYIEDEDDLEDFINDETEEDDATDAEDSDDDF
ncbi:hypothetical protein Tco_0119242, partial [Tanacetum coccineum]